MRNHPNSLLSPAMVTNIVVVIVIASLVVLKGKGLINHISSTAIRYIVT